MDGDSSVWRKGEQKLFFRRDACRGPGREDALSGFLFGMARYPGKDHMTRGQPSQSWGDDKVM